MKIYITDKNMKSTTGIRDIPYFSTQEDRDTWVSENLLDGKTIEECLSTSKIYSTQILNIVKTFIDVEYDKSLVNKNYMIVEDNISDRILFYHIKNMDMDSNSNMVSLSLELDSFMTYFEWIDNVENLELVQGHSKFTNYFDFEFDGGRRSISKIEPLIRNQANEGDYVDNTINGRYDITMVVYRRLKEATKDTPPEEGVKINGLVMPMKAFIAPFPRGLDIKRGNENHSITPEALIKYYNEKADGQTYNIGFINHQFFTAYSVSGQTWKINDEADGKNVTAFFNTDEGTLLELKSYEFTNDETKEAFIRNSFDFEIDPTDSNHFTYLNGLESQKIMVYGEKEITWPFNVVRPDNSNKITLTIGAFLAPNDNKTHYIWNGQTYIRDEENTWDNTTELAVFTNQANEYKANNPVQSKLDWAKPIANIASNPLNFINPATFASSAVNAGKDIIGTATGRMNMKKSPETVKGDANTYYTLATSPTVGIPYSNESQTANIRIGYLNVIATYTYLGNDRISIITSLYKFGATYESSLFVTNYNEIKRPKFNYLRFANLRSAKLNMELPDAVFDDIADKAEGLGITLWNDGYIDYDFINFGGNGDKINA